MQAAPGQYNQFMGYAKNAAVIVGTIVVLHIGLLGCTRADAFADCVREAAGNDLAAKSAFQRGMRDLIVAGRPQFKSVADVNMRLQVLLAERQNARLEYLLRHDVSRIETTKGLGRFGNFAWSDADTRKFVETSQSNRARERQIATLRRRNNEHPDWPKLRRYFRSELNGSPNFKDLMTRFRRRQREIETSLAGCHRS